MGRHFPVREKSGNFDQTGKVRENHTKYWKTEGISDKCYLLFLVISKWICVLFAKFGQVLKNHWKIGKNIYWLYNIAQWLFLFLPVLWNTGS